MIYYKYRKCFNIQNSDSNDELHQKSELQKEFAFCLKHSF